MLIFIWIAIFLGAMFVLVKSADLFTTYAEKIGLLFGMSSFIIGATIMAVGTSLPELVSSLYAVVNVGESTFVIDSIVGSNVANIFLILGVGAIVGKTLKVHTSLIDIDLPFFFISMGLFVFFVWDKVVTWPEAIMLLVFFGIFFVYSLLTKPEEKDVDEMEELKEQFNGDPKRMKFLHIIKYTALILVTMVLIALSAKYFIDSLLMLSNLFGVTSTILTLSVVAIGTSLPELITSIAAIRLGNHGMAIGNVFGSNIFNIALVGSIPVFFGKVEIAPLTLQLGIPFLIFATFAAIFITIDNKVQAWEGVVMLFIYIVFLGKMLAVF